MIVLQYSAFGRCIYDIGNSSDVAPYAGVNVKRVKMTLFMASGLIAALAGLLLAARLGAVRGSMAEGFELDVVTMVLLGGVSIFGGSGTLTGVPLVRDGVNRPMAFSETVGQWDSGTVDRH